MVIMLYWDDFDTGPQLSPATYGCVWTIQCQRAGHAAKPLDSSHRAEILGCIEQDDNDCLGVKRSYGESAG